jgi:isocitrate dehydrogenase
MPVEDLPPVDKILLGADVFVDSNLLPEELAAKMQDLPEGWELDLLSSRGVRVWPEGAPETNMVGLLGARLYNKQASSENLAQLVVELTRRGINWVHIEQLRDFEGTLGYSEIPGP